VRDSGGRGQGGVDRINGVLKLKVFSFGSFVTGGMVDSLKITSRSIKFRAGGNGVSSSAVQRKIFVVGTRLLRAFLSRAS
jgi:hypothetical protein